jgi:general stress protein YciG
LLVDFLKFCTFAELGGEMIEVAVNPVKESRVKFRGFASMSKEKVVATARSGGLARAKQLGHTGYVELGRRGGRMRSTQLTHEGFVEMGRKGGLSKKKKLTPKKDEIAVNNTVAQTSPIKRSRKVGVM